MNRSPRKQRSYSPKRKSPKSPKNAKRSLSPRGGKRRIPIAFTNNKAREFMRKNKEFRISNTMSQLDFEDLNLSQLPAWFFINMSEAEQLTELLLKNNQLTSLPKEIGLLTQLRVLDLGNNQLTSLPKELGKLSHLHFLYLGKNLFERIPYKLHYAPVYELTEREFLHLQQIDRELEIEEKMSKLNPLVKSGTLHHFNQKDIEKLLARQKYGE